MKVFEVGIDKLIPYIDNPRKNRRAVTRMMASIKFGFNVLCSCAVAERRSRWSIRHLRIEAARKLRMTAVPVTFFDEWSEAQAK